MVVITPCMEDGVNYLTVTQFTLRNTCSPKGSRKGIVGLFLISVFIIRKLRPEVLKKPDQGPLACVPASAQKPGLRLKVVS